MFLALRSSTARPSQPPSKLLLEALQPSRNTPHQLLCNRRYRFLCSLRQRSICCVTVGFISVRLIPVSRRQHFVDQFATPGWGVRLHVTAEAASSWILLLRDNGLPVSLSPLAYAVALDASSHAVLEQFLSTLQVLHFCVDSLQPWKASIVDGLVCSRYSCFYVTFTFSMIPVSLHHPQWSVNVPARLACSTLFWLSASHHSTSPLNDLTRIISSNIRKKGATLLSGLLACTSYETLLGSRRHAGTRDYDARPKTSVRQGSARAKLPRSSSHDVPSTGNVAS